MNFHKLDVYLDSLSQIGIPACDLTVYQEHTPIYRRVAGFSDYENTIPLNGHEYYYLYSATKIFTCVAALQLVEQGKLALDAPVYTYLPAYTLLTVQQGDMTRAAKTVMTVRHLMSMQSGMDYDINAKAVLNVLDAFGREATTAQLADAMAHKPLSFDPGTDYKYSLSHDVLGAVVEAVSGQRFGEYLKEHIMEPLGIHHIGFQLTDEHKAHLCAQYTHDSKNGGLIPIDKENAYQFTPHYESGGAGLIGGTQEYILLLDALACGGVGKTGERILRPDSIDLYRTPQLAGKAFETFKNINRYGYTYGLGVRVMADQALDMLPALNGEFGWDGAAGAYAMVVPELRLSAFYAQHVRGFGWAYFNVHPMLRSLIYEGLQ